MIKEDLKTGMLVESRDGDLYVVLLGTKYGEGTADILVDLGGGYYTDLDNYNTDLTRSEDASIFAGLNIDKVYESRYVGTLFRDLADSGTINRNNMILKWSRDHRQHMTIAEIEEKLGHKIKIIE